jgi:Asp/Glu/hydantoin racemase
MARLKGGRAIYGYGVGILMLDMVCPRPPGDIGNALTWPFPVRYRVALRGATGPRVMLNADGELLAAFIAAARELEAEGVRMITTSCGFLAVFQRELAAAVNVPVVTSALLQVPMVSKMIRPDQRIGILTASPQLQERHFQGVGWSSREIPIVIANLPKDGVVSTVYVDGRRESDTDVLEREMVEMACAMKRQHPDVGAIVLECTNFVPFSQAMRRATGLPIFDLYTLVIQTYEATVGTSFPPP